MSLQEKYKRGQYGYKLLSKVVNSYMDQSFNDGRKYYSNLLKMAAASYNDLFTQKLRISKNTVIHIDPSTSTGYLPVDYLANGTLTIVDECNMRQPLSTQENYNIVPITEKPKGCGCKKCNCDNPACGSLYTPTYLEETINVAPGVTGQKITQTKALPNGDIIEEITMPIAKGDGTGAFEIITQTTNRYIAKVELKPCGCVLNLPKNNQKVLDACGCPVSCVNPSGPVPSGNNKYGHFLIDEERGIIHFIGVKQKFAILNYNGNGECNTTDEILIPEYAEEYIKSDMHFRSMKFRNTISPTLKREAERMRDQDFDDLIIFLNPINYDELNEINSGHFYKW